MKEKIILLLICFCVFFLFVVVNHTSAYIKTTYELNDNWYGNKIEVASIASVSPNGVFFKAGQIFRCSDNITVSSVYIYVSLRQGTWTGTERLQIGLQGVNLATGYNNDIWLGATGDGKNMFYPASTGWLRIVLNESVSLVDGNMYSLVLYDFRGLCTNTKYLVLVANGNPLDYVNTNTLNGYYEEFSTYFQRLASGNNRFGTMCYLITDGTTYQGFPYLTTLAVGLSNTTITDVYDGNCTHQLFNVSENITVDEVSVYGNRKLSATIPTADLNYEIRLQSGELLRTGVLAVPLESSYLSGVRWNTASFSSLPLYTNGSYELRLWSNCALASSWCSAGLQVASTFLFNQSTYQGNTSCFGFSTNNGSTWNNDNGIDLQYKFRKVQSINYTDTSEGENYSDLFLRVSNPSPGNNSIVISNTTGQLLSIDVDYRYFLLGNDVLTLFEHQNDSDVFFNVLNTDTSTLFIQGITIGTNGTNENQSCKEIWVKLRKDVTGTGGMIYLGIIYEPLGIEDPDIPDFEPFGSINSSSITTGAFGNWYCFTSWLPVVFNSSGSYGIAMCVDDLSQKVYWMIDVSNSYVGGTVWEYDVSANAWLNFDSDATFKMMGYHGTFDNAVELYIYDWSGIPPVPLPPAIYNEYIFCNGTYTILATRFNDIDMLYNWTVSADHNIPWLDGIIKRFTFMTGNDTDLSDYYVYGCIGLFSIIPLSRLRKRKK